MSHDSSADLPSGGGGSSSDPQVGLRWTDAFLVGEWRVEPRRHRISREDEMHELEPVLMDLLVCLALRPGESYERRDLLELVWKDVEADEDDLERAVGELRDLLDDDPDRPRYIESIGRRGYRLIASVHPVAPGASAGPGFSAEQLRPRRAAARLWRDSMIWRTFGVFVVLVGIGLVFLREGPRQDEVREPHVAPLTAYPGDERDPALSPRGTEVAFAWSGSTGADYDIYVTRPGQDEPVRITDDPGADVHPVWSPDGRELIYQHLGDMGATLFRTSDRGDGRETVLTRRRPLRGFDWAPDGRHLVYADDRIRVLDLESRESRDLAAPSRASRVTTDPVWSPDGRQVAFLERAPEGTAELRVVEIGGGPSRRVAQALQDVRGLAWSRDGSALTVPATVGGEHALWRLPLDTGEPAPVSVDDPWIDDPSVARESSRMVYRRDQSRLSIWRIDLTATGKVAGQPWRLMASEHEDREPQISPDGRRVAFVSVRSGSRELWMCTRDGLDPVRLTAFDGGPVSRPRWSPDGRSVGFNVVDGTTWHLYQLDVDGGLPRRVASDHPNSRLASWSRDGRFMYFGSDRAGDWDLWRVDVMRGETIQVTEEGAIVGFESPDGSFLYYTRLDQPGLWRLPLPRGSVPEPGEMVFSGFPEAGEWDSWTVIRSGLVFLQGEPGDAKLRVLEGGSTWVLASISVRPEAGFALSADADIFLYDRLSEPQGDLMIVDGLD